VGNPYFFTGRRLDFETGLYYYRARMVSPNLGRFLQTDPIGYADGINWYAYCGNNPVVFVDPSGSEAGWVETFTSLAVQTVKGNVGIRDVGAMYGGYIKGGAQGAAAWADGVIPFADPFANTYNASEMGFSRAMGHISRDALLAAAIPNIGQFAQNPVLYEIGQKTLMTLPKGWETLSAIQRGKVIVEQVGWMKAILPTFNATPYATTIFEGLTPGANLLLVGGLEAADLYFSGNTIHKQCSK
jgi:RHS repeat-associated protein